MITTTTRPLYAIANDIIADVEAQNRNKQMPNWWHYAEAYVGPMQTLDSIDDMYYYDDARSVVMYALANLQQWRGDKARAIKAELKAMLK